jgi:A/G-specific adenine glycosylase
MTERRDDRRHPSATATATVARRALMRWYGRSARVLPWRSPPGAPPPSPWRVLVSELMLQQTTVATVNKRFAEFIARFPDPAALAAASEEEVFAAWSGLGYYRRAARLREAAAILASRALPPATAAEWRKLPGVGDYTAAAVASICFGERIAAVDTNLVRLLARWGAIDSPFGSTALAREAANLGRTLLDPDRPGDTNQALMDLGALTCTKRTAPACVSCPLAPTCASFASGRQEDFPRPPAPDKRSNGRQASPPRLHRHDIAIAFLRDRPAGAGSPADRDVLLWRRADASVYRGLWELPTWREGATSPQPPAPPAAPADALAWCLGQFAAAGLAFPAAGLMAPSYAPSPPSMTLPRAGLSGLPNLLEGVRHAITIFRVRLDLLPIMVDPPPATPSTNQPEVGAVPPHGETAPLRPPMELRWLPLEVACRAVHASPQRRLLSLLAPGLAPSLTDVPAADRGPSSTGLA